MNRRRFLKYAGTTAAVVGASTLGLDYVLSPQPGPANQSTVTLNPMRSTSNQNHPPVANFKYRPYYLDPTDQQTIQFANTSYDPDPDPLTYRWLVDNQLASEEKDYSTKLPVGQHIVELEASDSQSASTTVQGVSVEPDQIYPAKQLHIIDKGVNYCAGRVAPEWGSNPNPSREEMDEQLDTIHNELGCNAISIFAGGDHEDDLLECGRLAIEKGFRRIYLRPEYMNLGSDETVERIGRLAPRIRELRELSEAVVYCLGHEFGLESSGIIPGDNWWERMDYQLENSDWQARVNAGLPGLFRALMPVVKEKCVNLPVTYAAAIWEVDLVPWEHPAFESVCTDAYLMEAYGVSEDWMLNHFSQLKRYRKPIYSSEAGCMTFSGAGRLGGGIPSNVWADRPYDEDEQANYVRRYCDMLNRARIGGYFYTVYNDDFEKGYGLYNGKKRKKGFCMYKSYQRVS